MHGLTVAFEPKLSVVGIRTDEGINTLLVAQKLKEKNWSVNILQKNTNSSLFQLFSTPQVDGFHFCLTSVHAASPRFVETFTADLKSAIDYAKANPQEKPKGMFKAYGALEEGIPSFIQKRIGDGFAKINNAVPGKEIPGVWKPNTPAQDHADTAIITRNMR
jgi:hypothetical protein